MSDKNKKRFGVWMDTHQATVVGCAVAATDFTILGHARNPGAGGNSNENASNNAEIASAQKYFKEIGRLLLNAEEIHLTGTGQVQEQFRRYLGETAQFKKAVVTESTSNEMSDKKLIEFVSGRFN